MSDDEFLDELLRDGPMLTPYGYQRLVDTIIRLRGELGELRRMLSVARQEKVQP